KFDAPYAEPCAVFGGSTASRFRVPVATQAPRTHRFHDRLRDRHGVHVNGPGCASVVAPARGPGLRAAVTPPRAFAVRRPSARTARPEPFQGHGDHFSLMLDNEHYVKLRPVPVPPLGPGRSAIRTRPCLDSLQSPEPRRP